MKLSEKSKELMSKLTPQQQEHVLELVARQQAIDALKKVQSSQARPTLKS